MPKPLGQRDNNIVPDFPRRPVRVPSGEPVVRVCKRLHRVCPHVRGGTSSLPHRLSPLPQCLHRPLSFAILPLGVRRRQLPAHTISVAPPLHLPGCHDRFAIAADTPQFHRPEQSGHGNAEVALGSQLELLKNARQLGLPMKEMYKVHACVLIHNQQKASDTVRAKRGNSRNKINVYPLQRPCRRASRRRPRKRLLHLRQNTGFT